MKKPIYILHDLELPMKVAVNDTGYSNEMVRPLVIGGFTDFQLVLGPVVYPEYTDLTLFQVSEWTTGRCIGLWASEAEFAISNAWKEIQRHGLEKFRAAIASHPKLNDPKNYRIQ